MQYYYIEEGDNGRMKGDYRWCRSCWIVGSNLHPARCREHTGAGKKLGVGQGTIAYTVSNYPGFPPGDGAVVENMQKQVD